MSKSHDKVPKLTPEQEKDLFLKGELDSCKFCGRSPTEWNGICHGCWSDDL